MSIEESAIFAVHVAIGISCSTYRQSQVHKILVILEHMGSCNSRRRARPLERLVTRDLQCHDEEEAMTQSALSIGCQQNQTQESGYQSARVTIYVPHPNLRMQQPPCGARISKNHEMTLIDWPCEAIIIRSPSYSPLPDMLVPQIRGLHADKQIIGDFSSSANFHEPLSTTSVR